MKNSICTNCGNPLNSIKGGPKHNQTICLNCNPIKKTCPFCNEKLTTKNISNKFCPSCFSSWKRKVSEKDKDLEFNFKDYISGIFVRYKLEPDEFRNFIGNIIAIIIGFFLSFISVFLIYISFTKTNKDIIYYIGGFMKRYTIAILITIFSIFTYLSVTASACYMVFQTKYGTFEVTCGLTKAEVEKRAKRAKVKIVKVSKDEWKIKYGTIKFKDSLVIYAF